MISVGMHEAKSQLSKLVEKALEGEEVTITRRGREVVRLVPVVDARGLAGARGAWKGRVRIADDFDELPPDIGEALGL